MFLACETSQEDLNPSVDPEIGYEDVQGIWDANCVPCHTGGSTAGNLDLSAGPEELFRPSGQAELQLVHPGDVDKSYLWHKLVMTHTDVDGSGGSMPPQGTLDEGLLDIVDEWISELDGTVIEDDLPTEDDPPDDVEPPATIEGCDPEPEPEPNEDRYWSFASNELSNRSFPTGSTTLVEHPTGPDESRVVVVPDQGIAWVDADGTLLQQIPMGDPPARIALLPGDRIVVTLPTAGSIAILDASDGQLSLESEVALDCAEPWGVVTHANRRRFWVACSQSDEVLEVSPWDLTVKRRWRVPYQPRWLALRPDASVLYVATAQAEGHLYAIEMDDGAVREVALPVIGQSSDLLSARLTGDPAVSPDGKYLALPTMYVDAAGVLINPTATGYYGAPLASLNLQRFNPGVISIQLYGGGETKERAWLIDRPMRGYPSSVTFSRNSKWLAVPMPGADSVMFFWRFFDHEGWGTWRSNSGGFRQIPQATQLHISGGPDHVSFDGHMSSVVHNRIGRTVQRLPTDDVWDSFQGGVGEEELSVTTPSTELFESPLTPTQELGRQLFHSAIDPRVSAANNPVSCSSCHFDARTDGMTWLIGGNGYVQTPSLVTASHTAPYTWFGAVETIAEEAMITASERLQAPELSDLDAIEAYVGTLTVPDTGPPAEPTVLQLGETVFEESGCADCHNGAYYTDGFAHNVLSGGATATPTLVGIGATAPYMHDGSIASLEQLMTFTDAGHMGDTSELNCDEKAALVAFMRGL